MSSKRSPTSHSARNAVREVILAAFANTSMPSADRLVEHYAPLDHEHADIVRTFGGKHWMELDADTLEPEKAALSFFTPEAFRHYVPAFMLGSLEGTAPGQRYGRDITGAVVHSLCPGKKHPFLDRFRERIRGFTPQQKAAIREFLGYMQAKHPDRDTAYALRTYWSP